ncbi:MAG: hypothetical protein R3E97_14990 [Candidatus Eisenbacteria bacterium]
MPFTSIRLGAPQALCRAVLGFGSLALFAVPSLAQDYELLDLGASGSANQPWSISRDGFVAGYSQLGSNTQGFVWDGSSLSYVGIPNGTSRSDMLGVNNFGEAVGKSGLSFENGEALLWHPNGFLESLGTLGGSRSAGLSINDSGQIVGWSKLAGDQESRAFLYESGSMSALPVLGGTQAQAEWINASGQIVGTSTTDADGLQQFAVLWEGGEVFRLPPVVPGENNLANFIHDNGDIAGSVRIPGDDGFVRRAAIWRDREVFLTLGTLADGSPAEPFATSWASGVNARGEVVGMSVNAANTLVPFIYRDGVMTELTELMPEPWVANFVGSGAINDAGQIVLSAFRPGEATRAVILTPATSSAPPQTPDSASSLRVTTRGHTIHLSTEERVRASLDLYDVAGRHVANLMRDTDLVGDRKVEWDGRTRNGGTAPTGLYFVRLHTSAAERRARLVWVAAPGR